MTTSTYTISLYYINFKWRKLPVKPSINLDFLQNGHWKWNPGKFLYFYYGFYIKSWIIQLEIHNLAVELCGSHIGVHLWKYRFFIVALNNCSITTELHIICKDLQVFFFCKCTNFHWYLYFDYILIKNFARNVYWDPPIWGGENFIDFPILFCNGCVAKLLSYTQSLPRWGAVEVIVE